MLVVMHSHQQNLTVLLKGDVQMVCIQKLTAELQTLGLWDTQVDGRYRYRYQLIPGAFTLTPEMRMQLQDIARFTQGALAASAANRTRSARRCRHWHRHPDGPRATDTDTDTERTQRYRL